MTSNINPNNINGAYPVAGQDNNSQGFRDNFTNTATNFQYAADEITDLQNKAVLKAALNGSTLNNNMNGSLLSNAQIQDFSATVVNLGTTAGSVTLNYSAGHYQTLTLNGSASLGFSNFTAAGTQDWVILQVTITDTSYTLTLPVPVGSGASESSIMSIEGLVNANPGTDSSVITFAEPGTYQFEFITADGGSTIYINDLTRPRNYFSDVITANANVASNSTSTGSLVVLGGVGVSGDIYGGGNIIGNIDVVVANATYANTSGTATTVTGNAQANITSVGTLTSLSVTGNITTSATGNLQAGNISAVNLLSTTALSAVSNVIAGGNIIATNYANLGHGLQAIGSYNGPNTDGITIDYVTGNGRISVGGSDGINFYNGNVGNTLIASLSAGGNLSVTGSVTMPGLEIVNPNYLSITASNTYSLSSTTTTNILIANATGYTATLNFPSTPVDGQTVKFTVSGNAVTLATGTGTINTTYAGLANVGVGFRYVYRASGTTWYRTV